MADKMQVTILGGGMGSLAAAWDLVSRPNGDDYEITIYQRDWRLGGKCASGRAVEREEGNRIEEHGIHVLPGFYEHTFHLLKQVYDDVHESADKDKIQAWEQALTPANEVVMADLAESGARPWRIRFPTNRKKIGRPPRRAGSPTLYARGSARYRQIRRALLRSVGRGQTSMWIPDMNSWAIELVLRVLLETALVRLAVAVRLGTWIVAHLDRRLHRDLSLAWRSIAGQYQRVSVRQLWIAAWFAGTNLLGMAREGLVTQPRDFLALDDEDYMAWLERHSVVPVPQEAGLRPPPVQALYDLAFSHDYTLAAGTTLWVILHMGLDYKGDFIYEMNGGMGDVVFAPLYLALNRRENVHFEFFHEVEEIIANGDGESIEEIRIRHRFEQTGDALQPFTVNGQCLHCWPRRPPLIMEPVDDVIPLRAGVHFDVAILGISHRALGRLCPSLRVNRDFDRMLDGLETIQTQSLQLWLTASLPDLGWTHGSSMLISFTHPFNSWTNMEHLLPYENWPSGSVKTLAYFSDELPRSQTSGRDPDAVVRENARLFFAGPLAQIWPNLDWAHLYDPNHGSGDARLDSQYLRANVDDSDQYVLCVAGSTKHRLEPSKSGFVNLALAGDWVKTELNAGCVEAATLGGLGAARAIRDGSVRAARSFRRA